VQWNFLFNYSPQYKRSWNYFYILYIKTINPVSAYALHVLNNKHEYGNIEQTMELLKPCNKRVKMNIWESFFVHILQKQNLLIKEHKANDPSPLYELAQDVALRN
jgi:hypothetical protein